MYNKIEQTKPPCWSFKHTCVITSVLTT